MTRPLRIAFLGLRGLDARLGGVERHVEAVAARLAARGHEVSVYVRRAGAPPPGVRTIRRPTLPGKHADAGVHALLCALDTLFRRLDVVHVHGVGPSLFAWLPRLRGHRVVTTIHAPDWDRPKWGAFARAALRLGERCAFRFSHRTLVVSRHLADVYAQGGRAAELLPNGVEAPAPAPPSEIRARWGLEGRDYLLFLGRVTPEKRVRELVDAFRAVAPEGLRLVVAGAGADGLAAPGVVLAGPVEGRLKEELLAEARAYVSFSALEGQPIALLEAMARGRPCLGSDIPAHRELLAQGRGLVRPAATAAEREAALRELCALTEPERAALGRAASAYVREHHDWDRIVDRLEAVYREVL